MDGPVGGVLIYPLCCMVSRRAPQKDPEAYSRWDLVLWNGIGAISPTVRMTQVCRIVSGERVGGAADMLILRVLDKLVCVDVLRESHDGGEGQRGTF